MAESAFQLVSEIGTQLGRQTRSGKDSLLKSLKQAANALSEIEQPSTSEAARKLEAINNLEVSTKPLRKAIVHGLLQHKDKEVRLLVAICISEIFRVMAPEPPFEDKYLRDIFKLIVSIFAELADTASPHFSRRVKILETIARYKCCVIMLDIHCNDLVLETFNTFFSVVRENHQRSLINHIISIMTHIINDDEEEEEASQTRLVLDVILRKLVNDGKGAPCASYQLAVSIIQNCAEKLEPFICGFLTKCILDRDAVENELKEFYHEIIFQVFQCAPQILLAVIPNLTHELLTDQVDVRIKAVNLVGKLFALPKRHVAQHYRDLFLEFLKRFSDKSVEVRVSALQCVKAFYMASPSGTESHEVITALEDRLLDFDDKVRTQAVIVACDLAQSNLKFVPPKLISQTSERLRDKKIIVRKKAFHKLIEVYRDYCNKCSEGHMTISDHFEQIPCKILMLCFDKDCKEFRSQNMELVLAEDLFPVLLSVAERTRHWIHLFSLFTPLHVKALNSILSQKRRLQKEMQSYLALREKEKETSSEEMQKRIKTSFMKMAALFPDPSKAEDSFHKLNQMKDNNVFNSLALLLDELKIVDAQTIRDKFLKTVGDRHPHFEFLSSLSSKCSHNIFGSEHIQCILEHLSGNRYGTKLLEASSAKLLLAIISIFPSLLRGSEAQLRMLIEENRKINDKLIEVLAKAAPHISVKLSDIYPILERVCREGSRIEAKFSVAAIAAFGGVSEQFVFSKLCKDLVVSLHAGQNIPTVLQSLGCVAQYSVSAFEAQDGEITSYIYEKIFRVDSSDNINSYNDAFGCTSSCKLKIYGLKTLVKRFLPHQGTHARRQINELLDILSNMLQKGDAFDGIITCESDKAHMRLAAAKSVLQLSRRWDLHISPEIFRFTILVAKDSSLFVRRFFLDKMHKLLKEHVIPSRYACAFALGTSDCLKDLQDDSFKYMAEFIKEYSREARICQNSSAQGGTITDYPAYIVVFLIYFLAHDTGFPSENCPEEEIYAQFCSPLFNLLEALVNATVVDGDMDLVNDALLLLLSIFRAIKKAEDVVDARNTPRLHIIADFGFSFLKSLNHNDASSAHAPALILLPSSFFRAYSGCLNQSPFNDCFIKKVVQMFKSHLSLPITALPKHGRKCQEDNTKLAIIKSNTLCLAPSEKVDLSTTEVETRKNMRQDITVGHRQKQAVSSESVRLRECSINHQHSASKKSKRVLEKEPLSSCDSVTRLSLAESHISVQTLERDALSLKENVRASSNVVSDPPKYSKAEAKDTSSLNESNNKSETLIGQRIKVLSPIDRCFYSAMVDGYNSQNNTHKITYDSGEVEVLSLESESWETISNGLLVEREVVLAEESNSFQLQHRGLKGTIGSSGGVATTQQQKVLPSEECGNLSNRTDLLPDALSYHSRVHRLTQTKNLDKGKEGKESF
ncbi:sister chromatid cohesion protein PDS5 homolog A isoform X2 [Quercus lobata]|uniref:sister chromatid cohesion protein PDS5 homolog A isoform X2 n=1 Tax=Quercus lobata TaxID=97700 RepID=UPI001243CB6D|nr:sister chromatid cohesion protein PDS5 homolog A isoform X2 [Quercus lobata]